MKTCTCNKDGKECEVCLCNIIIEHEKHTGRSRLAADGMDHEEVMEMVEGVKK